jgi:hypothetical protein
MELQMRPVVIKTFLGATQAIAAEQYAADVVVATRLGYAPTSQTWDGTKLTVVYERQAPMETGPPPAVPEEHVEANARANQERAEANARANRERAEFNAWANQERAATNASPVPPPPPPGERTD